MLIAALIATVRLLQLPPGASIDPFGSRALMTVSHGGTIAATVTVRGFRTQPVVWRRNGQRPRVVYPRGSIVAFDDAGALLLDADRPRRWAGSRALPVDTSYCEDFPQMSIGPRLAGTLQDGALIATMQSPALVDLDDTSGRTAPVVLYLRSRRCLNLGNGIAEATAGAFTVGYAASIDNVPAPSNVVSSQERFTAMRWHERTPESLGAGVALAVASTGAAAGSDVPPGAGKAYGTAPHARYWPPEGSPVDLTPNDPLGVAYAVDERGRASGMFEDGAGRHYAFLYASGRLATLDGLVTAPGWRFECAYAFTPSGGLVGIGTYRGKPAAFEIDGL
ncbi:MAG TPA: hypothetical protein VJP76_05385 [Candidatus Tumulicola sp.]|nr:hypothetical protein [Candidatus Tumulicola sp.]